MSVDSPSVLVRVPQLAHWRVNLRPDKYEAERLSLNDCFEVVERSSVRLRGWSYPRVSRERCEAGTNWIASWADFLGHIEYWRLYQSTQFLPLFAIREASDTAWRERLEAVTKSHLFAHKIDWGAVPGFIDIANFLYSMTEIFEFAARLAQAGVYEGNLTITVELRRIRGFVLTMDWDRGWFDYFAAAEDVLARSQTFRTDLLIAESAKYSLDAVVWFLQRFGWLKPSLEVLRRDQETFLSGVR